MTHITLAIPTYGREQVLIDTIESLLALQTQADELLIVDQTPDHEPATSARLAELEQQHLIRIVRQAPSIPQAMNRALREAKGRYVLFVDDDIIPAPDLIRQHLKAHKLPGVVAVVGQVLQPGEQPVEVHHANRAAGLRADLQFCFRSTIPADVRNVMAGNLSVSREAALAAGGFDENFVGAAYRFETEFARRLIRHGGVIRYEPRASIHHLAAARGGTRSFGKHLTSARPEHSVGDYYFAMFEGSPAEAWTYSISRFFRSVRTKFHLTHPWWIPIKLLGEVRGFVWAVQLKSRGQRILSSGERRVAHGEWRVASSE